VPGCAHAQRSRTSAPIGPCTALRVGCRGSDEASLLARRMAGVFAFCLVPGGTEQQGALKGGMPLPFASVRDMDKRTRRFPLSLAMVCSGDQILPASPFPRRPRAAGALMASTPYLVRDAPALPGRRVHTSSASRDRVGPRIPRTPHPVTPAVSLGVPSLHLEPHGSRCARARLEPDFNLCTEP